MEKGQASTAHYEADLTDKPTPDYWDTPLPVNKFFCPSGANYSSSYIPYHWVCNNEWDCFEGEDERDCPKPTSEISTGLWRGIEQATTAAFEPNSSAEPTSNYWNDHFSTESPDDIFNCPSGAYYGSNYISDSWVCDNERDCNE